MYLSLIRTFSQFSRISFFLFSELFEFIHEISDFPVNPHTLSYFLFFRNSSLASYESAFNAIASHCSFPWYKMALDWTIFVIHSHDSQNIVPPSNQNIVKSFKLSKVPHNLKIVQSSKSVKSTGCLCTREKYALHKFARYLTRDILFYPLNNVSLFSCNYSAYTWAHQDECWIDSAESILTSHHLNHSTS